MKHSLRHLTYTERDQFLRKMKFPNYRGYLDGKMWRGIRRRVFTQRGGLCSLCKEPATQAHHLYYTQQNLSGASIDGIVPICRVCHKDIEFDLGTKLCEADALEKYRKRKRGLMANQTLSNIFECFIDD